MLHTNTLTKQLEFLESLDDETYALRSVTPSAIYLTRNDKNPNYEHNSIRSETLTKLIKSVYKLPNCSVIVTN